MKTGLPRRSAESGTPRNDNLLSPLTIVIPENRKTSVLRTVHPECFDRPVLSMTKGSARTAVLNFTAHGEPFDTLNQINRRF
jgi:hypothetical protein